MSEELKKKDVSSITFVSEKGHDVPLNYFNFRYKFLFLEGNAVFIVFLPLLFPFSTIAWSFIIFVLILMYRLNRKKLPTWQFFRYLRRKCGPRRILPGREQCRREQRGTRPWPF